MTLGHGFEANQIFLAGPAIRRLASLRVDNLGIWNISRASWSDYWGVPEGKHVIVSLVAIMRKVGLW